jgi:30S ribosomal protein S31
MGRGDIKTKKGKTFAGSFGKSRPAKTKKTTKKADAKKS